MSDIQRVTVLSLAGFIALLTVLCVFGAWVVVRIDGMEEEQDSISYRVQGLDNGQGRLWEETRAIRRNAASQPEAEAITE